MSELDHLLGKAYDAKEYVCATFAAEAWKCLTGQDLMHIVTPCYFEGGQGNEDLMREFVAERLVKIDRRDLKKSVPAIITARRKGLPLHMGVWVRGMVVHLGGRGFERVELRDFERLFDRLTFYNERKENVS